MKNGIHLLQTSWMKFKRRGNGIHFRKRPGWNVIWEKRYPFLANALDEISKETKTVSVFGERPGLNFERAENGIRSSKCPG